MFHVCIRRFPSYLNPFRQHKWIHQSILKLNSINLTVDENIEKYLQHITNEFYNLKVGTDIPHNGVKRMHLLSPIVSLYEERKVIKQNLNSPKDIENENDADMAQLMKEENAVYNNLLKTKEKELIDALLSIDEGDDFASSALEITAGVGGQEAMLFAKELFDMYTQYAEYRNWDYEVIELDKTEIGGIRHVCATVTGDDAYSFLKHEGGVHRVQRIPATEKSGRVHTSTVSVAVIPKPDDFDIKINENDLKIETKRASGAGGQHVNTTDSAVRIVHIPTGIVVDSQKDRSQIKNKEIAIEKLKMKLFKQKIDEQLSNINSSRKAQVGSSNRNEKIRTYNYNQDRITDHRLENGTVYNLKGFLAGTAALDDMIIRVGKTKREKELIEIVKNTKFE